MCYYRSCIIILLYTVNCCTSCIVILSGTFHRILSFVIFEIDPADAKFFSPMKINSLRMHSPHAFHIVGAIILDKMIHVNKHN